MNFGIVVTGLFRRTFSCYNRYVLEKGQGSLTDKVFEECDKCRQSEIGHCINWLLYLNEPDGVRDRKFISQYLK